MPKIKKTIDTGFLDAQKAIPTKLFDMKKFSIMKKVAKHGNQTIIIVPRMLEASLKPGMIVKLDIEILEEENER